MGPRIYVASLSDYNSGRLHGAWIDADQDVDDIHEEIKAMLAESKEPIAEEWAIHDHDEFAGVNIGENESIETVSAVGKGIAEHGEGFACFVSWRGLNHLGDDPITAFQDCYQGCWKDTEDFAYDQYENGLWGACSEALVPYIDFEKMARDLFMGDYWSAEGDEGIHIFTNQ